MGTIRIAVKPGSKRPGFTTRGGELVLSVREKAIEGDANAACVRAIARALGVPLSHVVLASGARSRIKVFSVNAVDGREIRARLCGCVQ